MVCPPCVARRDSVEPTLKHNNRLGEETLGSLGRLVSRKAAIGQLAGALPWLAKPWTRRSQHEGAVAFEAPNKMRVKPRHNRIMNEVPPRRKVNNRCLLAADVAPIVINCGLDRHRVVFNSIPNGTKIFDRPECAAVRRLIIPRQARIDRSADAATQQNWPEHDLERPHSTGVSL